MTEIGLKLRQARLARGMTLEEIALTTRITRSSLEAIEAGDRDVLPAEVFVRGFVRSYAIAVELAPEPLLVALANERDAALSSAGAPQETPMPLTVNGEDASRDHYALLLSDGLSGSSRMRFGPAALVVIALVLFFSAWIMAGTRTTPGPPTAEPATPVLHQNHVEGASTTVGLDAR